MLPYVDLKRMRYVIEVARAGGITNAAEVLGVTQSALSRSVAEVEMSLGTPLFQRLPRGTKLTSAGERFVAGARRILGEVEVLCEDVRGAGETVVGPLRIGFAPRGYILHASKSLKAFAEEYSSVTVEVSTGSAERLCPLLLNGELDIIIGSSSRLKRWKDLRLKDLRPFRFAIMARKDHPLALADRPLREIDILQYPMIMFEDLDAINSDMALRYAHHGLPPFQARYVLDDFATISRLLLSTDAVCPYNSYDFSEVNKNMVLIEGVVKMPENSIALAENALRSTSPAARRFAQILWENIGPTA
jgi:DNA-binding transcriptional LysR family regulator